MLPYKVVAVEDYQDRGWEGILVVSNRETFENLPDPLKVPIKGASCIDKALHSETSVLGISLPAQRLIYSSTGTLNPDYDDVRSFAEAAAKGVKRALKAGVERLLLVLMEHEDFSQVKLVTLLGAMEALYTPLHYAEVHPEKKTKLAKLGIWSNETMSVENLIKVATALECGRIVARDIGGGDPERMAAPRVEEYVLRSFPPITGVKVEVIKDDKVLDRDYPLFAAVNRSAKGVDRHKGRVIYMTYEGTNAKQTVLLVGKGITYDTGGADLKVNGAMAGMSRDKCGAAAVTGFLKTVSILAPTGLRVIGALCLARNSVGSECYVSDEIIQARSGKLVRIGNTDAEGRMVMADVLCHMKDIALQYTNSHLMTVATLTGHACLTVGNGYSIAIDNGPAKKSEFSRELQNSGERIGDMVEISTLRREDFRFILGKSEGEDLLQANTVPSSRTPRGHQFPMAFLASVSGLDKHGMGSEQPLKYTHLDIAGSAGEHPHPPTAAPLLALAAHYLNLSV